MIIRIKNLRLRAIIGVHDWERTIKQNVVINAHIEFDGADAILTDQIEKTLDYKTITKRFVDIVESSKYFLIETLADRLLESVMEDSRVERASIEVDKPRALRFTDSVSATATSDRAS